MKRTFTVTIDGPAAEVANLHPVHVRDAVSEGLDLPYEFITAEEGPA